MKAEDIYRQTMSEKNTAKKIEKLKSSASMAHIPSIITLAEYGVCVDTDDVSFAEGKNYLERLERMAENMPDALTFERLGDMYGLYYLGEDKFNYCAYMKIYNGEKALKYYDRSLSLRVDKDVMTKKGEILYREHFQKDALSLWKLAAKGDPAPSQRLLDDILYYYEDNPWDHNEEDRMTWIQKRAECYGQRQSDLESAMRILVHEAISNTTDETVGKAEEALDYLTEHYESAAAYNEYSDLMFLVHREFRKAAEYKLREIEIMEKNGADQMFIDSCRRELDMLRKANKR